MKREAGAEAAALTRFRRESHRGEDRRTARDRERERATGGKSAETEKIRVRIVSELKQAQSARMLQRRRTHDDGAVRLDTIVALDDDPSCACRSWPPATRVVATRGGPAHDGSGTAAMARGGPWRTRAQSCAATYVSAAFMLQEDADLKTERIRATSPWGQHESWRMFSLIVKVRDDLRQEQLACQIVRYFGRIWAEEGLALFVYPYVASGPPATDGGDWVPCLAPGSRWRVRRERKGGAAGARQSGRASS